MVDEIKKDLLEMFSDIRFDESKHLYYVNGENYPSVSKKLEDHYEKFVKEDWLPRCANKASKEEGRWVSEEELDKRWSDKNRIACDMGHDTHDFLERYKPGLEHLANIPQKRGGLKFFGDYIYSSKPRYSIIGRELRMVHRTFKYCGTTDMILLDNIDQSIVVADWKTNEDLTKTYGYLKAPFDHFASNPFNKYQLQFSYYQLMLMQSKYRVSNRLLIYLDNKGEYAVYNCEDLTKKLEGYLANPNQYISTPANYGLVW